MEEWFVNPMEIMKKVEASLKSVKINRPNKITSKSETFQ